MANDEPLQQPSPDPTGTHRLVNPSRRLKEQLDQGQAKATGRQVLRALPSGGKERVRRLRERLDHGPTGSTNG